MAELTRRELLGMGLPVAATLITSEAVDAGQGIGARTQPTVRYCLNTSTIRGAGLPLPEVVRIAAEAGYQGIEPWIREIDAFVESGGRLEDLRKQIADAGLVVEGAIGFAEWIVDDPAQRKAGLEQARRDMEIVRAIGGNRIAAPPTGATREPLRDLAAIAERYAALCRMGDEIGVAPALEVWGFSATLSRLGETLYVLAECGEPSACLLPDVYHLYKGGSNFEGLAVLAGTAIPLFHMNDYPANPVRTEIRDADRVYPGEGIAPLDRILGTLFSNGFAGALSLELFNETYWKEPPADVARRGLAAMKSAVARVRNA